MRIYLVERTDAIGMDEYDKHVVYAESPRGARRVAKTRTGDEGKEPWEKAKVTLVGEAPAKRTAGIICCGGETLEEMCGRRLDYVGKICGHSLYSSDVFAIGSLAIVVVLLVIAVALS